MFLNRRNPAGWKYFHGLVLALFEENPHEQGSKSQSNSRNQGTASVNFGLNSRVCQFSHWKGDSDSRLFLGAELPGAGPFWANFGRLRYLQPRIRGQRYWAHFAGEGSSFCPESSYVRNFSYSVPDHRLFPLANFATLATLY